MTNSIASDGRAAAGSDGTVELQPVASPSGQGVLVSYPESLDHMLAAWNENDPTKVRGHLERALAADVEFIDPSAHTRGIDEFEANVHEVQASLPGAEYSRTSSVDSHHRLYRYRWQIVRDGELVLPGFDVTEVDDGGKVTRVLGFFGALGDAD